MMLVCAKVGEVNNFVASKSSLNPIISAFYSYELVAES
jgi:hypothetical protein